MSPFGIESLPADTVRALRTLPVVVDRLDELPALLEAIASMASNTEVLPGAERSITAMAEDTRELSAMHDVMRGVRDRLDAMDGRVAAIEGGMPDIARVQEHLAELPGAIGRLDEGIAGLTSLLQRLVGSLETLDANISALHETMQPLGSLAEKLPGSGR